jgi:hypothetical protein
MGQVLDINTGRVLEETDNPSRVFLYYVQRLILKKMEFYVVHGVARHREYRQLLGDIDSMGVTRVLERRLDEQMLILDGTPDE